MNSSFRKVAASPIFLDRAGIRGRAAIVAQMADDMRIGAATTGSFTERDMETLGWTPEQIALHGQDAGRRARSLAVR